MSKWYRVGCSKCGAIITSLEIGKTIVGFHDPLDGVKYEPDIVTRVEHNGTIKSILCSICAGDSFDPTKFCTTSGAFDIISKFVRNLKDIEEDHRGNEE